MAGWPFEDQSFTWSSLFLAALIERIYHSWAFVAQQACRAQGSSFLSVRQAIAVSPVIAAGLSFNSGTVL